MNIAQALAETSVAELDLTRFVRVTPTDTVCDTISRMNDANRSCAAVADGARLEGIFTQRDVLTRIIGHPSTWERPIRNVMSRSVRTMRDIDTVAAGLAIMVEWWVRNVPVLNEEEHLVGNLSFYTVMNLMAESLASRIEFHPGEVLMEHALNFVDFTGLNMAPPVIVQLEEPVSHVAHHMRARGIGSVLVEDHRGQLAGIVTEFDLQTKVGCEVADPSTLRADQVMSEALALSPRSSVAEAIREIAKRGQSNVPLVAESGRPAGVAGFRDVANFVESSIGALA